MRADASCEGRRDPAMFEIKLCVADLSLGVVHGGLRVIRSGLAPNDRVIIDGIPRAVPGAKVAPQNGTIRNAAAAGAG